MTTFWAQSDPETPGKLSMGSEHNRARFSDHLKKNLGAWYKIEEFLGDSPKQRRMFEGAYIPMIAYFQENIDYNDPDDLARVRSWVMLEFNAAFLIIGGKALKVPKSSKGELNRWLMKRILDWMADQAYPIELLNPNEYKKWRDSVRPFEGPKSYIDYLVQTGKLRPKKI
jgi:hypothetical protein